MANLVIKPTHLFRTNTLPEKSTSSPASKKFIVALIILQQLHSNMKLLSGETKTTLAFMTISRSKAISKIYIRMWFIHLCPFIMPITSLRGWKLLKLVLVIRKMHLLLKMEAFSLGDFFHQNSNSSTKSILHPLKAKTLLILMNSRWLYYHKSQSMTWNY